MLDPSNPFRLEVVQESIFKQGMSIDLNLNFAACSVWSFASQTCSFE